MPNSALLSYDTVDGVPVELTKLPKIALCRPLAARPIVRVPAETPLTDRRGKLDPSSRQLRRPEKKATGINPPPEGAAVLRSCVIASRAGRLGLAFWAMSVCAWSASLATESRLLKRRL